MFARVRVTGFWFVFHIHTFLCPHASVPGDYTAGEELSSDLPVHPSPPPILHTHAYLCVSSRNLIVRVD